MAKYTAEVEVVFNERLHYSRSNGMDTPDTATQKMNDVAVIDGFTSSREISGISVQWLSPRRDQSCQFC